ncbi:hypothetical protein jhhlp_005803 [Lomentospora prolificans]|uniref:Uncharacterized protein n=1 Tax=Lomentospora prolificans TaxID=41688 RepID=A0A2N3N473_9PEZI|nr:hypothetical protein jhhlp_005803 [Lomentospora prolificans]
MGIPYSKEISAAFDEVTPLVAAAFQVLRTSRNVTICLAIIQILNTLFLSFAVLVLIGILLSVSPDLEIERNILVTPTVRWFASWFIDGSWFRIAVWTVLAGGAVGAFAGRYFTPDTIEPIQIDVEGDATEAKEDSGS